MLVTTRREELKWSEQLDLDVSCNPVHKTNACNTHDLASTPNPTTISSYRSEPAKINSETGNSESFRIIRCRTQQALQISQSPVAAACRFGEPFAHDWFPRWKAFYSSGVISSGREVVKSPWMHEIALTRSSIDTLNARRIRFAPEKTLKHRISLAESVLQGTTYGNNY
ncbi:hypothetical protein Bbelb_058600 [Branchiostoma belcheri]|nr:hypothetical protein Bbelb_058600 [Branchiostoma belcheri]